MSIENFPLAWRWTSEAYTVLPPEILQGLHPVAAEIAMELLAKAPNTLGPDALTHENSDRDTTRKWLRELPVTASEVTLVWNQETALNLPWSTFVSYWSDFCYPSSDDVAIFIGTHCDLLLWHHYEVFEFKTGAF